MWFPQPGHIWEGRSLIVYQTTPGKEKQTLWFLAHYHYIYRNGGINQVLALSFTIWDIVRRRCDFTALGFTGGPCVDQSVTVPHFGATLKIGFPGSQLPMTWKFPRSAAAAAELDRRGPFDTLASSTASLPLRLGLKAATLDGSSHYWPSHLW